MADKKEEKRVKVMLFKDNGKYSRDVKVTLNGKKYVIKRGVEVEVPVGVKEILDNSYAQDMKAADYMKEESDRFEKESNEYKV